VDVFLCREGFEAAVAHELKLAGARILPEEGRAGLVAAELLSGVERPDPAFASQSLPEARRLAGDSVAKLARGVFEAVAPGIDLAPAWTLHAVAPETEDASRLRGRATLLGREVDALVREKLKRAHRRRTPWEKASPTEPPAVLQIVLARPDEAWVSLATPGPLPSGWLEPSLAPLGRRDVGDDRDAPSSAFRKVEEAYLLLGRAPRPGERVADLGAAPGGWTWTALKRGASVTAVDRAELLPPVRGHERLVHLERDATSWEPDAAQDWLLCDAIMIPQKTLELLERWLAARWCRAFVVNVKFKGEDYAAVPKLRALLVRAGVARARVKQLAADKNEVTCLGELPPA
jgi:23S rRNA (cytidine2498-2'-O)-methyltransferase